MSKEYIEREALIEELKRRDFLPVIVKHAIEAVPAADVALVVHGEWWHLGGDEWCCTNCGNVIHTEGSWERPEKKYCDECGAKMMKEEANE